MQIANLDITIQKKNIKNMYLRVLPPHGEVVVSAPLFLSDEEIISFVKSRKEWILKKQERQRRKECDCRSRSWGGFRGTWRIPE